MDITQSMLDRGPLDVPCNPIGRYAIYFAPRPGSRLWTTGSEWLGWDAASATEKTPPTVDGVVCERHREVTRTAARYGFHATLKPPFYLASPESIEDLDASLRTFSSASMPVALPTLVINEIGGFIAIQVTDPSAELQSLAEACVREFDPFRAPASATEHARRLEAPLTDRQRAYLENWGYPYVFEEWRFHMTLTARLQDEERNHLIPALQALFAPALCEPAWIKDICLFHQETTNGPFRILRRYPLGDAS